LRLRVRIRTRRADSPRAGLGWTGHERLRGERVIAQARDGADCSKRWEPRPSRSLAQRSIVKRAYAKDTRSELGRTPSQRGERTMTVPMAVGT
jgi:hypothetical protein